MRDAIGRVVLLAAGIAILSSAVLHGLVNVPHLHADLLEIPVRGTLVSAVMLVLYFSVVAMFGFGVLVLGSAVGTLRGRPPQQAPLWIVAAAYVVFGAAGYLLVSHTPHMLGYAAMGILVATGALCSRSLDGNAPSLA